MAPTTRSTTRPAMMGYADSPLKHRMTRSRTAAMMSQSQRSSSKYFLHRSLPATPTPPKTMKGDGQATPGKKQDENMRVFVRIRPPMDADPSEMLSSAGGDVDDLSRSPYDVDYQNESICAGGSWFTFDGLHAPSSSSGDIYAAHVSPMVRQALDGYNASVFAYGSTGSGKTHSLMGNWDDHGIVPRAVAEVFDLIEQDETREYVVRVSYLEIYNETLRDLLADPADVTRQGPPKIHEDKRGRIFVRPLVATPCSSADAVLDLLVRGETRRRVAATEWNAHSSRSHTVFSLTFESRAVQEDVGVPVTPAAVKMVVEGRDGEQAPEVTATAASFGAGAANMPITPSVSKFKRSNRGGVEDVTIRISQLNLVDLAGSERATDDEARNKESSYIKKSLLALQAVVTSLAESPSSSSTASGTKHVPYRNSQLTRLLQTSLSGNAKVAFLCTIAPDPIYEVDTLSTLRFAKGAKQVVTKAEVGQVVDRASLLLALEKRVVELEQALLTNADLTEALERERDEANERADGASKAKYEYELKLAELQNQRTPLKEQHDHLRRLIVTGSPRSPYSNNEATSPLASRVRNTPYKPSRLSHVQTPLPAASPSKRTGWTNFLFGSRAVEEEEAADGDVARVEELELELEKMRASLVEAEETHQGQVVDLQDELAAQKAENDAQMSAKELEVQALLRRVAEMEKAHAAEILSLQGRCSSARVGCERTLVKNESP